MNKKATLEMITTAILLVTFVLVVTFLSVVLLYLNFISGTAAGKVSLSITVASLYQEDIVFTYLTDEDGNKLTDIIGQVIGFGPDARLILRGDRTIERSEFAETADGCPDEILKEYNSRYNLTTIVDVEKYLRCYLIPEKMAPVYGQGRYCVFVNYERGEDSWESMIFGNRDIPGCTESEGMITIAAPPGKFGTLTIKVENI